MIKIDRLIGNFKVICTENFTVENRLTVGKEYEVLEVYPGTITVYRIRHDRNRVQLFSAGFFKKISR